MPPVTGRVIAGRYSLQQPIGHGAMGVVWRARDMLLDRDVAVKEVVLSASIGADERKNAYQRTLREARTAARLSHRGVVTIYDVAEEDGRPWIVMELVPSRSLDQVLATEGRLKPLRAGRIGRQLLAALAAAHAAGVLHRDVKPSNVLIARDGSGGPSAPGTPEGWDERAVLTDFGIAQFQGDPPGPQRLQPALGRQHLLQRPRGHELHDDPRAAVFLRHVVDGDNAAVAQPCRGPRLAQRPLVGVLPLVRAD